MTSNVGGGINGSPKSYLGGCIRIGSVYCLQRNLKKYTEDICRMLGKCWFLFNKKAPN
jgi:hypothetical protein